jgi:hypothetical protein
MAARVVDERPILAEQAKSSIKELRVTLRLMRDKERMGWNEISKAIGVPAGALMLIAKETVAHNGRKAPEYRK